VARAARFRGYLALVAAWAVVSVRTARGAWRGGLFLATPPQAETALGGTAQAGTAQTATASVAGRPAAGDGVEVLLEADQGPVRAAPLRKTPSPPAPVE